MGLFEYIAIKIMDLAVYIILPFKDVPWWLSSGLGFLGISAWLVGGRLSRLTKPDRPYLSPVIRTIGNIVQKLGILIAISIITLFVISVFLLFMHQFIVGYSMADAIKIAWSTLVNFLKSTLTGLASGFVVGLAISLPLVWRIIPGWERGGGLPDVKELVASFKKLNGYDPLPYIKIKRGCFIGLGLNGKPIYVPWRKLRETHIQVIGMTGSGKGVAMSLIAYQCVLAGESVIWFDPKFDRYSPRILQAAAKRAGREFYVINLNPDSGPQINPFHGASEHQIEELLVAGFDLRSQGTDGDFYRGKDEDAATESARVAIETGQLSVSGLFKACSSIKIITDQENFWRRFRKLATLSAINTADGLNLVDALSKNAVIYVIGSADNERVKMLQKMLLVRLMQIIKSRDRLAKYPSACIVLDEFKHMLSPSAFTSLGVIRDYDVHIMLAHQSMGDLHACPGIDPVEAHGAVVDNTSIKIVYKIGDEQYAERLARVSGSRRTYVDNSSKQLGEDGNDAGSWREDKVQHINADLITHLPMPSDRPKQASVGVLYGIENARLFYVGPIPVSGDMPTPVKASPFTESNSAKPEMELI